MAPRRGAETIETEEARPGVLVFDEALTWRAGKPIAVAELLGRLETLANELREMDQDLIEKDSLLRVAKDLAGQHLLGHKDKGVRAYTACCLVDILKLSVPNAPYKALQLKDIFTFFITSILPALSDPSNTYNVQHKYVLESLAEVKSIVLITDVPSSDHLILHLFSSFFDITSGSSKASTGESLAKDVEYQMSQVLVMLVDEVQALPPTVVDVIVAQFLRASTPGGSRGKTEAHDETQSTLLMKELPEAYNMAKTICNMCPEKMARYISQYFNEVILDVSTGVPKQSGGKRKSEVDAADSDDEDVPSAPSEADMKELEKAHKLLRELWRACPPVLQNVIPQLEAELSAENVDLRLLATQTLGDIVSGIGAAGPPPSPIMDPSAYPPASLEDENIDSVSGSILTTPASPQSFATAHPGVYHSFLGRRQDKSPIIRAGWTTAVGRILVTSAGGIGLSPHEEAALVKGLAEKLNDADERVRLAAIKAVGGFNFRDIITKLGPNGGVGKSGSVLCSLADRARDRKHAVRVEGMTTLGRIWGVAAGEIAAGNETVIEALGAIPSKVFDVFYANDLELNVLLDHVMFEQLIPLNYPPSKPKRSKSTNGNTITSNLSIGEGTFEPDRIRTERILHVVKSLDPKSLKAFFAIQARQPAFSSVVEAYIKRSEEFNGGVSDGNVKESKETKAKLDAVIKWLSDFLPDPLKASADLHKYSKLHDRRSYQLLRYAIGPQNDFKTVNNAIKEFAKRMKENAAAPSGLMETFIPILYRSSSIVYNRSHQPVILQYSRTDEKDLGATAKRIITEISEKHPEIFKANVKELSKTLGEQAPTETRSNDAGSVDTLKALASFAKAHPEQIPKDRKFIQGLVSYALYGTPPKAAKYAISILMEASDRKEMHAEDLLQKSITDWEYGSDHFLTKLATISQLTLLDPKTTEAANDEILNITTQHVLLETRTPATGEDPEWQADSELDEECQAKIWALKILVNRLRTIDDIESARKLAVPVYKLLNTLIVKNGELSKKSKTPLHHKNRLRLIASQLLLKLCTKKMFDDFLSPVEFNRLAVVAQDEYVPVRHGFIEKLQKYIVKSKLSHRFITIMFLTAFEPEPFASSLATWIRSRVKVTNISKSRVFESLFPRLLHLLAHHPDYSEEPNDLKDNARYILYYLNTVASEDNTALIFKYAERVKQGRDAIDDSDKIYVYSDVAQSLIRVWLDKKGWTMQTWPVKVGMPIGLFAGLPSHEVAQEIAEKSYMPEDMEELLEDLVKTSEKKNRRNKRKADDKDSEQVSKKSKTLATPKVSKVKKDRPMKEKKTPKSKKSKSEENFSTPAASSVDRRRSGRGSVAKKSYADLDKSEDEADLIDGVASWYMINDGNEEGSADGSSDAESEADQDMEREVEEDDEPQDASTPEAMDKDVEQEPEVEVEKEDEEVEEEEEEEEEEPEVEEEPERPARRTTSRSNGKKSAPAKPVRKAAPKAQSRVTKAKPKAKPTPKSTPVKPKAKEPIATKKGRARALSTRTKPKGDFEMDSD